MSTAAAVSRRSSKDMTEGTIWKQVLVFAFPLIMSNLLQQFYNTMDAVIVGQYVGKVALAAVGSTGSTVNLINGFFIGLSSGASVVIAHAYGGKRYDDLKKAVHTAVALALIVGILLGVIGIIITPHLLRLMGSPDDVFDQAVSYLRITFAGLVFTTTYNIGAGILRAVGDSKRPLYYLAVCSVLNIGLNLLLVVVFNMGVSGVALATIIAQSVSTALVMINLMHTTMPHKVYASQIRIHISQVKEIVRIGLPAGIQSTIVALSNVIIQSFVNAFGSTTMAAFTAANKIDTFIAMPSNAIRLTATTFTGQNIGAKKLDRVKKGSRICILMGVAMTACIGIPASIFSEFFVSLLTNDPEVIAIGSDMTRVMAGVYWILAIAAAISGVVRGSGSSVPPMVISMTMLCGIRIIWFIVLTPIIKDYHIISYCYPFTWICDTIAFTIYYFKGNWFKKHEKALAAEQ